MKKILLLSDTHSYLDERILHYCSLADEVWHAGDIGNVEISDAIKKIKPLRAVYGNIDGAEIRKEFPKHLRFIIEDIKVWMTHIGGYPGKYSLEVKEDIQKYPPDLFISGHSHILKVMQDKKLGFLHMNPGAAGKHGFQKVRTMIQFEIDKGKIQNLVVIELGKK